MEFLQRTKAFPPALRGFIKFTEKSFGDYKTYTYTVRGGKNDTEDDIYNKNKDLLKIIYRGHTIVTKGDTIIGILSGPTKFSGKTAIDEDPDDDAPDVDPNANNIYDHAKVIQWATDKKLKIIRTIKENGKFAIMTIMLDHATGDILVVFGSKNNHYVMKEADFLADQKFDNKIIQTIYDDIKGSYETIKNSLLGKFNEGYTLVGESCDGQHFTDGDNKIRWFGLFKDGSPFETLNTLSYMRECGISTVDFSCVYDCSFEGDHEKKLESIFLESRCMPGEGCVLYNINTETNEVILVKSKSAQYIIKRFMRQIIMRVYAKLELIRGRFVDAAAYHGLNTEASIRLTNQLINFGIWMMNKNYPTTVLGVMEIKSVRGQLPNGFNIYWKEYMTETGASDLVITEADFGEFNSDIYMANTKMYKDRNMQRTPVVVFIQGLQGSGKSTIADRLVTNLIAKGFKAKKIEQDVCWGDTLAAQGQLYHWASDENDIIIVSRCNIMHMQYKRYLDIAEERKCLVLFFTPENINHLYFAISMAGIMKRSAEGDKMMIGRFEYDISEVFDFTVKNYNDFDPVRHSNPYTIYDVEVPDADIMLDEISRIWGNKPLVLDYIAANKDRLNSLRFNIDDIVTHIENKIITINPSTKETVVYPRTNAAYIGFVTNPDQKKTLIELASTHMDASNMDMYAEHITQIFYGGKKPDPSFKSIQPFTMVDAHIDYLLIADDGIAVYHVDKITQNGDDVPIQSKMPHITCLVPKGRKPSEAIKSLQDDKGTKVPCDFTWSLKTIYF